jgi:ATP-dependent Clp protease ATP-binding subunit ClpA
LAIPFDPECQEAVERAKRSVPPGAPVRIGDLLAALAHAPRVRARFPALTRGFPEPWDAPAAVGPAAAVPASEERRPVEPELGLLLAEAAEVSPVTVERLLAVLVASPPGERAAIEAGVAPVDVQAVQRALLGESREEAGRREAERAALRRRFDPYGRLLSASELPPIDLFERGDLLATIARTLVKLTQNNVLLVGASGIGKTAIVREFARQVGQRGPLVPPALAGWHVFEVSGDFVQAGLYGGASVDALVEALRQTSRLVVFVDDLGDLLFPDRERRVDGAGRARLLAQLVEGSTPVIGCLRPKELRQIQRDARWSEQFDVIRVPEPAPETARKILADRVGEVREHYRTVEIPDAVLGDLVATAREALPALAEPLRSLRFLDEVCAVCASARPPVARVDAAAIERTLHERGLAAGRRRGRLTEAQVREHLDARVIGQEGVIADLARAFVAGLGGWADRNRPRGVFLFGGPTGVGKTETAVLLAGLLDPTGRSLIRINCNVLQGNANAPDAVIWPLLGVPRGFVGHGEGGLLGPIVERPDAVILFDEFEKADPAVGKMLLQILDTGQQEDNDGNLLDFRRAYLVFTSNLGCDYESGEPMGFAGGQAGPPVPSVDKDDLFDELLQMGYGQEFLGRIRHTFLFQGLTEDAVRRIAKKILEGMTADLRARDLALEWDPALVDRLVQRWRPKLGVRHLAGLLQHRVVEQVAVADAEGTLVGVTTVRLAPDPNAVPARSGFAAGARRELSGPVLRIWLE